MTDKSVEHILLNLDKRLTSLELEVSELHREFEALGRAFGAGENASVDEGPKNGENE